MSPSSTPGSRRKYGLLDLPSEVLRLVAEQLYDPLVLTQQDRLTWGIFSTVDMSPTRQAALDSLIEFGWTCRQIRKEVKVVLFRCIRTTSVKAVENVISHKNDWGTYVRSIIIDLTMFEQDQDQSQDRGGSQSDDLDPNPTPRSCWRESALLIALLQALPNLEHLSFFADQSDDSTLVLMFATLIPHPSLHPIPPPTPYLSSSGGTPIPKSRSTRHRHRSLASGSTTPTTPGPSIISKQSTPLPLASRIRSFGWRQRSKPPEGYHAFSTASTFVSTLHLMRHAHNLEYLVLDADMDNIRLSDITIVLSELRRRKAPPGEKLQPYALTLCGPIVGWTGGGEGLLEKMVEGSGGYIGELFLDRPLEKRAERYITNEDDFIELLSPLRDLPHLRLLQIGSYCFTRDVQMGIACELAMTMPSLRALALNGMDNDTSWWGIWKTGRGLSVRPLADGDLRELEDL